MNIYQFGLVLLPDRQPTWDDALPADVRTVKTLGGHFNAYRGEQAPVQLPRPIVVTAYQLAATASALGTAIDALRGMIGKRDRLWMTPYDTAQVDRWCWATLRNVADRGSYKDRIWQRFDLTFEAESYWNGHAYGGSWAFDTGQLFDNGLYFDTTGAYSLDVAGTYTQNLANAGNRPVTNCGITYTVGAYASNNTITISTQNCEFQLLDADANDVYVIDCGSRTVKKNGSSAYQYFRLTSNHASPWWFEIAPGGEDATIQATDYDTVQFTYSDGWY